MSVVDANRTEAAGPVPVLWPMPMDHQSTSPVQSCGDWEVTYRQAGRGFEVVLRLMTRDGVLDVLMPLGTAQNVAEAIHEESIAVHRPTRPTPSNLGESWGT